MLLKSFYCFILSAIVFTVSAGTLTNGHLKIIYHDKNGGILFIDGASCAKPLNVINSFSVYLHPEGKTTGRWINFADFKPISNRKDETTNKPFLETICKAEIPEGIIEVEKRVTLSGPGIECRIKVLNKTSCPITKVRYPDIKRLAFSKDGANDELLYPLFVGMLIRNPRINIYPNALYPGSACMDFIDLSGEGGGIAVLGRSHLIATNYFYSKSPSGDGIAMGTEKLDTIRPGREAVYEAEIFPHKGDWREAARHYREYFYSVYPKPDYPERMKYSNACYSRAWGEAEYPVYGKEVKMDMDTAWALGLDFLQFWGQTGRHTCPGYPLADPMRGGEEKLKYMYQEVIRNGFYTGGYFWSCGIGKYEVLASKFRGKKWTDFPKELRPPTWEWMQKHAVYTAERKPLSEKISAKEFPSWGRLKEQTIKYAEDNGLNPQMLQPLVFHSEGYQNWLRFWIDRYINEFKIQTPYLDVYAFRPSAAEFNPYLNMWGDGKEGIARYNFLRNLNMTYRKKIVGFCPYIEGFTDAYATQAASLITHFRRFPEAVRYTFPEMVLFEGMGNGHWEPNLSQSSLTSAWVDGIRFDLFGGWITHEEARITWLREPFMPLIGDGAYLWKNGIQCEGESDEHLKLLCHCLSERKDGTRFAPVRHAFIDAAETHGLALINLKNLSGRNDLKMKLPPSMNGKYSRIYIIPLNGKATSAAFRDEMVITVPNSPVSAVLLVAKDKTPNPEVLNFILPELTCGGTHYAVTSLNLTDRKQNVRLTLKPFDGKEVYGKESYEIAPWDVVCKNVTLNTEEGKKAVARKMILRLLAVFNCDGKDQPAVRRNSEPFFPNPDFEEDYFGERSTKYARSGRHSLFLAPKASMRCYINFVPETRVTVTAYLRSDDGKALNGSVIVNNHFTRKTYADLREVPGGTNGWKKFSATFKNDKDAKIMITFLNRSSADPIYVDDVEVTY